jgi:hypothetical protein
VRRPRHLWQQSAAIGIIDHRSLLSTALAECVASETRAELTSLGF